MLTVKEAYKEAFALYRKNWKPLLFFSLGVGGVLSLLYGYLLTFPRTGFFDVVSKVLYRTNLFPQLGSSSITITSCFHSFLIGVITDIVSPLFVTLPILAVIKVELYHLPLSITTEFKRHWKDILLLSLLIRAFSSSYEILNIINASIVSLLYSVSFFLGVYCKHITLFGFFLLSVVYLPFYYLAKIMLAASLVKEDTGIYHAFSLTWNAMRISFIKKTYNFIILNLYNFFVIFFLPVIFLFPYLIINDIDSFNALYVILSRLFRYLLSPVVYLIAFLLLDRFNKGSKG